jgi:general secretion pathway protein H
MIRGRQAGFTFLELILVIGLGAAIFGILLSFAPRGASSADLKAAARAVASGLRQAQSTALATRRDTVLSMDLDERSFTFTGASRTHTLPEGVELKLFTAQSEVQSERKGGIRFHPDGSSTGGRVTLATGPRQYTVDVDWLTGKVTIGD